MLRLVMASSRYIIFIAVVGTFVASVALIVYEAIVVAEAVFDVIREGSAISPKAAKVLAVGLVEALDVFLIAIVAYIISLGLYVLFIDDTVPLPRWLEIHDLEDLKEHLLSVVVAVLAILFLREAVARAGDLDLLQLGIAVAVMIAALTIFLAKKLLRKDD
ncbi:MAG TPA: YqhA family protein [Stellaceae bacterium]|nr:YqhA family protein [Stellaceae bacterium]